MWSERGGVKGDVGGVSEEGGVEEVGWGMRDEVWGRRGEGGVVREMSYRFRSGSGSGSVDNIPDPAKWYGSFGSGHPTLRANLWMGAMLSNKVSNPINVKEKKE